MTGLPRRERVLIGIELLLSAYVDLVLRRSGKNVIQFPFVLHCRHPVLGQTINSLLLLGSGDRYDLEARLRKQELFPGSSKLCVVGSDGLTCGHQSQCRHGAKKIC